MRLQRGLVQPDRQLHALEHDLEGAAHEDGQQRGGGGGGGGREEGARPAVAEVGREREGQAAGGRGGEEAWGGQGEASWQCRERSGGVSVRVRPRGHTREAELLLLPWSRRSCAWRVGFFLFSSIRLRLCAPPFRAPRSPPPHNPHHGSTSSKGLVEWTRRAGKGSKSGGRGRPQPQRAAAQTRRAACLDLFHTRTGAKTRHTKLLQQVVRMRDRRRKRGNKTERARRLRVVGGRGARNTASALAFAPTRNSLLFFAKLSLCSSPLCFPLTPHILNARAPRAPTTMAGPSPARLLPSAAPAYAPGRLALKTER